MQTILTQMLEKYSVQSIADKKNVLKEVVQEVDFSEIEFIKISA